MEIEKCRGCKFADTKALQNWLKGKDTPYCTNGFRKIDEKGNCLSRRVK